MTRWPTLPKAEGDLLLCDQALSDPLEVIRRVVSHLETLGDTTYEAEVDKLLLTRAFKKNSLQAKKWKQKAKDSYLAEKQPEASLLYYSKVSLFSFLK